MHAQNKYRYHISIVSNINIYYLGANFQTIILIDSLFCQYRMPNDKLFNHYNLSVFVKNIHSFKIQFIRTDLM